MFAAEDDHNISGFDARGGFDYSGGKLAIVILLSASYDISEKSNDYCRAERYSATAVADNQPPFKQLRRSFAWLCCCFCHSPVSLFDFVFQRLRHSMESFRQLLRVIC